ncbi:MAG: hydrolase, partial [Arthrobacter sp.]|nr:hydrolase [Arthrobacter sp.]
MKTTGSRPSAAPALFSNDLAARTRAFSIDLGGTPVAYWVYEPVHATPDTRTILVIHGFRGDHHGLLRVADHLPDMRLIMPDLPGFGSSGAFVDGEHSVSRYGRFIKDFLDALGLGPDTVLLGHSFGS